MKIPNSARNKALIIVDVQKYFLNDRNKYIIENIKSLIEKGSYDLFIEAIFYSEKDSLWDKQTNWFLPKNSNFYTVNEILDLIKDKDCIHVEKETKSVFKGNDNLLQELKKKNVQEVHIVGLDANDCVLATAYEAFDLGFYTYVIEECTDSSYSQKMRDAGFEVLQHVNMTNNSCIENIDFIEINV
jgi:nicotinamidase-related amidase